MYWEWYQDSHMLHLFCHLLLRANHAKGKWQGQDVERGQLITGRLRLNQETGISERSIRTCLLRLKDSGEVTIKTTNRYSIITICNYDKYQGGKTGKDQQSDQLDANNRPEDDHKQEWEEQEVIPPPIVNVQNGGWNEFEIQKYVELTVTQPDVKDPVALKQHIVKRIKKQGGLTDRDREQLLEAEKYEKLTGDLRKKIDDYNQIILKTGDYNLLASFYSFEGEDWLDFEARIKRERSRILSSNQ